MHRARSSLKEFHVRHLLKAAKRGLEWEKTEEPAGEDNKINVIRQEENGSPH